MENQPEQALCLPSPFTVGCRVRIKGLIALPEMNGCIGTIIQPFNSEKQRWPVCIKKKKGAVEDCLLKEANIELLDSSSVEHGSEVTDVGTACCQHIGSVKFPKVQATLNSSYWRCNACSSKKSADVDDGQEPPHLWLCLQCGLVFCDNPHAYGHASNKGDHHVFMSLRNGELSCMSCSMGLSRLLEEKETKAIKELKRCVASFNTCLSNQKDQQPPSARGGSSAKSPKCADESADGSNFSDAANGPGVLVPCPRGLVNQGNTCFFNSVLQNVFNLPAIKLWATESHGSTGGSFARAVAQSCLDIFSGNSASFLPKRIFNLVCAAVPMFKDMHQQDSLELLCVLLDSIRTEEIGMKQSCQLKRNPNFIDDVFGGVTRSVVVCSRCCRPSVALERTLHTSVCFPSQLVDSLRPQRAVGKNKNKGKAVNTKQGGKFKNSNKNNSKGNQAENEEELSSPRASGGRGSPETTPPPSGGRKKAFKNQKQQQRELMRQMKANKGKGKGGFSSFEPLDEDAEEQRRQSVLEAQKLKEEAEMQALSQGSQALSAESRDGERSDDAASRGSVADAEALDDDIEPTFAAFDLFEESEDQIAEKERRRLQALEEHKARLGGIDPLAERTAAAKIDQQEEEEAILADDTAPRSSYSGRYASFDPDELDAVMAQSHAQRMPAKPSCVDDLLAWAASPDNILIQRPEQELKFDSTNLIDMLRCGCNIDILSGSNQYSCPFCNESTGKEKVLSDGVRQMLWVKTPQVLVVHVKRFAQHEDFLFKVDSHVNFPKSMSLDFALVDSGSFNPSGCCYRLCGVVNHSGNLKGGHYTSFTLSGSQWYYQSDTHVRTASEDEVLKSQAYMLFYTRENAACDV